MTPLTLVKGIKYIIPLLYAEFLSARSATKYIRYAVLERPCAIETPGAACFMVREPLQFINGSRIGKQGFRVALCDGMQRYRCTGISAVEAVNRNQIRSPKHGVDDYGPTKKPPHKSIHNIFPSGSNARILS